MYLQYIVLRIIILFFIRTTYLDPKIIHFQICRTPINIYFKIIQKILLKIIIRPSKFRLFPVGTDINKRQNLPWYKVI